MPFVTFEGIEGCGKSTQARRLAAAVGAQALLTQEPGGTEIGRTIRELLLDNRRRGMAPAAEVLLFFADRAQHVAERVRPALEAGRVVISDRYADSSLAYQGYGRGLALPDLRAALQLATGGLTPELTLFLDVPVEVGLGRIARRGRSDRLESEQLAFHERVRAGYLSLAAAEPRRWLTIDGTSGEEEVFGLVLRAVQERLGLALP